MNVYLFKLGLMIVYIIKTFILCVRIYKMDLTRKKPCVWVPSQAIEQLFHGRDENSDYTDIAISFQMHFQIIIMQESSDDIFKEISKLHFIQRAGNMRKQWIGLLNVCLAHLSMQEGVSICVMRVKWRKANGILQELNAVPLNCWSAPFLRTRESRFLLVLLLISLNLWMFGFRYFLCISLFNFEVFMHVYSEKKSNFQCTPTRTNSTIPSQHNPPNFTPSHLLKNNPLSTMLSICM